MATVIRPFKGVPDGTLQPRQFIPGDTVEGSLARSMIDAGFAEGPESKKKPPRDKSAKPDRDKSHGVSRAGRVSKQPTSQR